MLISPSRRLIPISFPYYKKRGRGKLCVQDHSSSALLTVTQEPVISRWPKAHWIALSDG